MTFKITKNYLWMASVALLLGSCSKNDEAGVKYKNYADNNGTYLNISTQSQWSVVKTTNGGSVHYNFIGSTNADRVTVTPNQSGIEQTQTVTLASDKSYSQDVVVSSFSGPQVGPVNQSITVNAYRGSDVLTVNLNSGNLSY